MFRPLILSAALALPALAGDDISTMIAQQGLAGAQQTLAALPDPDEVQRMGLAGVEFLLAIEAAYQARWQAGLTDPILPVPLLGTALPPNDQPQGGLDRLPTQLAQTALEQMAQVRKALPERVSSDAGLRLNLDDLWLDVNANARRDPGEDLLDPLAIAPPEDAPDTPREVRFAAADVAWLRAYSHLIEGTAQMILAFDPQPVLAETLKLPRAEGSDFAIFLQQMEPLATLIQTLRQTPDAARIGAAADNFRQMVASNREFWTLLAEETDDDAEWIPNDRQSHGALGLTLPEGTGDAWLAVLDQLEAVLDGDLLIPHWRWPDGQGISVAAYVADPAPLDAIGWVQGTAALPYIAEGQLATTDALEAFASLVANAGDPFGYALLLN